MHDPGCHADGVPTDKEDFRALIGNAVFDQAEKVWWVIGEPLTKEEVVVAIRKYPILNKKGPIMWMWQKQKWEPRKKEHVMYTAMIPTPELASSVFFQLTDKGDYWWMGRAAPYLVTSSRVAYDNPERIA